MVALRSVTEAIPVGGNNLTLPYLIFELDYN
jgi:hypothetical protein